MMKVQVLNHKRVRLMPRGRVLHKIDFFDSWSGVTSCGLPIYESDETKSRGKITCKNCIRMMGKSTRKGKGGD